MMLWSIYAARKGVEDNDVAREEAMMLEKSYSNNDSNAFLLQVLFLFQNAKFSTIVQPMHTSKTSVLRLSKKNYVASDNTYNEDIITGSLPKSKKRAASEHATIESQDCVSLLTTSIKDTF